MRLTKEQTQALHSSLKNKLKENYELYLYGSRVDDNLKGGDIDLLILTSERGVRNFSEYYLDILVEIKKQPSIGDRRLDIKAATSEELEINPFLKSISKTMIKI